MRGVRYSSLQVGRGLAALLVVLHHTVGRMHIAGIGQGVLPAFLFGFLGVDFFFVLSGFIIAYTLSNPGLTAFEFAARRAIRILPVFWLIFAVSGIGVLLMPQLLGHDVHYSFSEIVKSLLLLRQDISDGRSNPPIVGVAWTLHHEVFFYAIAGLWLLAPRATLVLAGAVLLASLVTPRDYPQTFFFNPLNLEFAFGVLAYVLHARVTRSAAFAAVALGVLALPVLYVYWPPLDQFVNESRVWSAGAPLALVVCGLAALEKTSRAARASRWNPRPWFERLGDVSYALYLVHYPVVLVCLKIFSSLPHERTVAIFAYIVLTAMTAIGAAACIHFGFERPVQRLLEVRFGFRKPLPRPQPAT
jgi:peptidoglycan/LPS O-acetylase OafA/YrhL